MTLILGIESSCDETAAAVVADGRFVLSSIVASQHELHRKYGGVVPEIASRAHLERIGPVVDEALKMAGVELNAISAVAIGHRPGLIGSLLVGLAAAKALAWSTGKPLIGVDHVHAHLHAAALVDGGCDDDRRSADIAMPALGLVVSGGHTSLYELCSITDIRLLGHTIDDAVGEAYDKAAVILAAGYPGGPAIDKLAQRGDPTAHDLPRAALRRESLDFSFSGLKTALLYAVQGRPQRSEAKPRASETVFGRSGEDLTESQRADFAASFQAAAVDALILKIERALGALAAEDRSVQSLIIGGGVSANSLLRCRAAELGETHSVSVHLAALPYCVDNAAMIAGLGCELLQLGRCADLDLSAVTSASI